MVGQGVDEVVIIVNSRNELTDYTLYTLGIKDQSELKGQVEELRKTVGEQVEEIRRSMAEQMPKADKAAEPKAETPAAKQSAPEIPASSTAAPRNKSGK